MESFENGPEEGVSCGTAVKLSQRSVEVKLPADSSAQGGKMLRPSWVRANEQPPLCVLFPILLMDNGQDGFVFQDVQPTIMGGKPLLGWKPDVGSIRRELAENPGTAGQIIGRFR
jgi:hypothetical protein